MTTFWSDGLDVLEPYVPGEQPRMANLVKLNTNENPYGPSPQALAAIAEASVHGLQLYPDPQSQALRQAIASHHAAHGLTSEQLFLGNGSDEVLAHAFRAFFQRGGAPLLMPDISYSFYKVYCNLFGIQAQLVPLRQDWQVGVDDYLALPARSVAGVVIANPNAPTGIALPLAQVERLLQHFSEQVVLVDEAYVDFGGDSALALLQRHPNLLVVHTLSKSRSLAGLRVGFAAGHPQLIEALTRVKDSFNSYPLGRLAQAGAKAAYEDVAYFRDTTARIIATREALVAGLQQRGFEVLPSAANFVFARHAERAGAEIFRGLRERAVLVRHFGSNPRIRDFLRITVGTEAQNQALFGALDALLG
ncbi:histidinol-phosphate transaminase [Corticibacter populi]|uniref:Histidinol-phosphate aminotransferase n=1 Tax=Corticibacter populi TaxID=1550736 RepID=A0A3M6R025_9BURK|nr:histidinol-phosphate transaminase [Corticibacter populi]RMX08578.1 histidinol-phosphate transaminase [Corticibacter populi]RZS35902.1 histidinol-phosphate aminotransferase [Corticibacter populi]